MAGVATIPALHLLIGLDIHPPVMDGATRHKGTGVHHHRPRVDDHTHHPDVGILHGEPDVPIHHRGAVVHHHHRGPDVLSRDLEIGTIILHPGR